MVSIHQSPHSGRFTHTVRLWKTILQCAVLLAALSACASLPEQAAPGNPPQELTPLPSPTPFPAEQQPSATRVWEVRPISTPPPGAERVPGADEPMQGEAPPALMSAILEDAVQRSGASLESVQVLRAEAVEWPDGSLGCPQPGVEYLQVITPGYWVELQVGEVKYDYRATQSGALRLCENLLPAKP